jgi:hypothetical protein
MGDIENPMVIDSLWRDQEKNWEVHGECAGCEGDIFHGDEYFELEALNGKKVEKMMVHQNADCCMSYVHEMSFSRIAGEK